MREITVRLHEVATDGLPDMEALGGRVAFIFDGCIVSGWPLPRGLWEANTDVGHNQSFGGVTHWVEFPLPLRSLEGEPSAATRRARERSPAGSPPDLDGFTDEERAAFGLRQARARDMAGAAPALGVA